MKHLFQIFFKSFTYYCPQRAFIWSSKTLKKKGSTVLISLTFKKKLESGLGYGTYIYYSLSVHSAYAMLITILSMFLIWMRIQITLIGIQFNLLSFELKSIFFLQNLFGQSTKFLAHPASYLDSAEVWCSALTPEVLGSIPVRTGCTGNGNFPP